MANKKIPFQLIFNENLKRDAVSSFTKPLSFDQLGSFIEEREKVKRLVEQGLETELKVDYSNLSNHVFFDSAVSKFNIAKDRILNDYPYNGTSEEKDAFNLTGSGYEGYILEQWPRSVGYLFLNGTDQYISASDTDNDLLLGSSSLYVSAWIKPAITNQNIILQVLSSSTGPIKKQGYDFFLSGATDPHVKFTLYSGSQKVSISSSYTAYTGSFNNVSVIYDNNSDLLSLYVNNSRKVSASVVFNSIEFAPISLMIGSGSQYTSPSSSYDFYSGSLDEIRVFHTASELYHLKNYNRPIDSEDFVALNYRFNEGIVGTSSIDQVVVDYSKSTLHGVILNYTSTARVSGTSMALDPGDPILYSFHSGVIVFSSSQELSASAYDNINNNQIKNLIGEYILSADAEQESLLTSFSFAMARFFDELKLYIDQFENLRITNYQDTNQTPDLFLPFLTRYFGWKVTDHFGDSNPLEFFFGDGVLSTGSLDTSLFEIRNQFWRRILNNLPYLLKTKGKRYNLDAFFNVLGVNKDNISIKEYGYTKGTSIQDTRIHKEKSVSLLGIGTGSLSSSFIKVPLMVTASNSVYTIETLVQLPYVSASYSSSIKEVTGSLWQFIDPEQVTGSFGLYWRRNDLTSPSGSFVLSGTGATFSASGGVFSSSVVSVFDGRFLHVAAGIDSAQLPFIELRSIDNDAISFSGSYAGTTALSGVFTGSKYDFIIGANSGSIAVSKTHGFFGEARFWSRKLSGSELDDHALNFESIGTGDPLELPYPLRAQWALNENKASDSTGVINGITDLSRNKFFATGSQFLSSHNPYKKFLLELNYLSPNIDLKWTENKIRIHNKSELKLADVSTDTNEVSLEFNLVDALNQDISKIYSTIDTMNNVVGAPVNKYRDEYVELENIRRRYFDRLNDSINFTNFFKLFRWFDKKLSDSIKQLLPTRVKFIGGEQVVESHFLERNKYGYKFPIFRTPKDIDEGIIASGSSPYSLSASHQKYLEASSPMKGTTARTVFENDNKFTNNTIFAEGYITVDAGYETVDSGYLDSLFATNIIGHAFSPPRDQSVIPDGMYQRDFNLTYGDGDERNDRVQDAFFRRKLYGDENARREKVGYTANANVGINNKNEFARRELSRLESLNFDGYSAGFKTGSFIHPKIGIKANVFNTVRSSQDNQHYFGGNKKQINMVIRGFSGSYNQKGDIGLLNGNQFSLAGTTGVELSQSLFDKNNVYFNTGSIVGKNFDLNSLFNVGSGTIDTKYEPYMTFMVSASNEVFTPASFTVEFKDDNSAAWSSYKGMNDFGLYVESSETGWRQYRSNLVSGTQQLPRIIFDESRPHWRVSCSSGKTYAFKDFKLEFNQQLTDDGVRDYQKLDNTNNEDEFIFINRNILGKIE